MRKFQPLRWLRLRATRSRDIRAPNTDELSRPQTTAFQTVNGTLTPTISGGSSTLVPESADTSSTRKKSRGMTFRTAKTTLPERGALHPAIPPAQPALLRTTVRSCAACTEPFDAHAEPAAPRSTAAATRTQCLPALPI